MCDTVPTCWVYNYTVKSLPGNICKGCIMSCHSIPPADINGLTMIIHCMKEESMTK